VYLAPFAPIWFEKFLESANISSTHAAGLDHWNGYKDVAVFFPYGANGEGLQQLLNACSKNTPHGLRVEFSGRSTYDPRTFRIAIFRVQDVNDFRDLVEIEQIEMLERANDELLSASA
jgi:hypothetical protein